MILNADDGEFEPSGGNGAIGPDESDVSSNHNLVFASASFSSINVFIFWFCIDQYKLTHIYASICS